MNSISVSYTLVYQIKGFENYKFTECGQCFNVQTGRKIKKTYSKGSIGYCIKGKFRSLKNLRSKIELIPKEETLPF